MESRSTSELDELIFNVIPALGGMTADQFRINKTQAKNK